MQTPWSTEVRLDADGDNIIVELLLSVDPGPARGFRPFLDVPLDAAHATELLGKLVLALEERRQLQGGE